MKFAALIRTAVVFTAALIAACASAEAPQGAGDEVTIETVGNRADLISGGNALVRVWTRRVAGAPAIRLDDGRIIPLELNQDGSMLALVTGLREGRNVVSYSGFGRTVSLTITNHPNGGPLFSGPQIQPWPCRPGATDPQCNRPVAISWSYMPTGEGAAFQPYDQTRPPANIARLTVGGAQIPYIVRTETFTQNRSEVRVAALYNPFTPWTPFAPQPQWNKGVYVLQGSGCGTGYGEAAAGSPMNARALSQGFIVVTAALLHNTVNCNPVVQAEAAIMAKEHVAETYGPFDIVFGQGSSGGAISQIMDQNAYPGIYDGLILNHLFADSDASRRAAYDCRLVGDAWAKAHETWTEAQKIAVTGMQSGCAASPTRFEIYKASVGTNCNIPAADKFDPATGRGVRCTIQDYEVNQVGRRPDGYAYGRLDTVGVQYGLKALLAGTISPAQFVELNANVPGHDINFNPIPGRTVADRAGLRRLYQTGLANTETNLSETAIIETRLSVTDFHQPFHAVMVRARLDRAQGHHDNYALWRTPAARETAFDASFDVMVQWLRAIKADTRDVPRARKVIDNKPALARDRCIVSGADQALTACARPPELTRTLAGAPDANDSGKCQLKRLNRADYGQARFTDEQWGALQRTFPSGVCDYAKPMVDYAATTPWLTYDGDGKARPLGPPPRSR